MRVVACCLAFVACGEDVPDLEVRDVEVCLESREGTPYCIDTFEASRKDASADSPGVDDSSGTRSLEGRLPWTNLSWTSARAACESRGKRLCERDEWLDACDGQVGEALGTKYLYGDVLDTTRCNTGTDGVSITGAFLACKASTGTHDQAGNVWEWTGGSTANAAARGGSFRSSATHECRSGDSAGAGIFSPNDTSPELGFRCCRDR